MKIKLSQEYDDFITSFNQDTPTSIRINPRKPNSWNNRNHIPWSPYGFYLNERPSFTLDPHFHAGSYYVQEASSMFIEQAIRNSVDLNKDLAVLDLCAAPGGKSTHILSLISEQSLLVSNEVIKPRASILKENITKWGYPNVVVTGNDPNDFQSVPNFFDLIVVDAPCSGEGLFRKDVSAVNHWSVENLKLCALRQQRILEQIWPSLKPDGILIYSTCTYNEEENEENLKWLYSKFSEIEFLEIPINREWGIVKIERKSVIGYQLFPHKVNGEGFFISILRKKESGVQSNLRTNSKNKPFSISSANQIKDWLLMPEDKFIGQNNDTLFFTLGNKEQEMARIQNSLRVISLGTEIGTIKNSKIIPHHALAMSVALNKEYFNKITLDKALALSYLRKENKIEIPDSLGFNLVQFENNPMGWVNVLPNRINNLYPTNWRIRMS